VHDDSTVPLDDNTIVSALAAHAILRGYTFIRWFNGSLAIDHLEATSGHNRVDLEKRLLEWTLTHRGGYEIVTHPANGIGSRRGAATEPSTLEVWLPFQEWQRFPEHQFPSGLGREWCIDGSAASADSEHPRP
jgi:hypothetical protein